MNEKYKIHILFKYKWNCQRNYMASHRENFKKCQRVYFMYLYHKNNPVAKEETT